MRIDSSPGSGNKTVTTQVLTAPSERALAATVEAIANGELVILPTDTVYGVGANAFDERAIARLFAAKQRSLDKGIPILIADVDNLGQVATRIPAAAEQLIHHFWPGPLTLVLPKRNDLPRSISRTSSIAVRIPDHDFCRQVIRAAGGAVATSSANLSGRPAARTVDMALADLAGLVTVAVDAGSCQGYLASTVVDCTSESVQVLREGPLTGDDLMRAVRF